MLERTEFQIGMKIFLPGLDLQKEPKPGVKILQCGSTRKKKKIQATGRFLGGLYPPQIFRDSLTRLKSRYVQIASVIGQQKGHEDLSRAINGIMKEQRGRNEKGAIPIPISPESGDLSAITARASRQAFNDYF